MHNKKKIKTFVLDTSAILSGKPINFDNISIVTTDSISNELKPGGRDYQSFQFLIDKGLSINSPTKKSIDEVNKISIETGDINRLSKTDIEIIALALDINKDNNSEVTILTDDYSIQNVAYALNIKFEPISQSGITKKFKWSFICRGCGKKFKDDIKICPICGAEIKSIVSNKKNIN